MTTLRALVGTSHSSRSAELLDRLRVFVGAIGPLDGPTSLADADETCSAAEAALDGARPELWWLGLSVLSARIADTAAVEESCHAVRRGSPPGAVVVDTLQRFGHLEPESWPPVSVHRGGVLVDVDQVSRNPLGTGIQRVVRQTARRWGGNPETTLVGWADGYVGLRKLSPAEVAQATDQHILATDSSPGAGGPGSSFAPLTGPTGGSGAVLIPWRTTLLVAELAIEDERPSALAGIARFARSSTGLVGYDCVPLTMPETTGSGMVQPYMRYLAACAYATRIAAISETAASEFHGWRSTLASRGMSGPEVQTVELATEVPPSAPPPESTSMGGGRGHAPALPFAGSDIPLVVAVGSHEPRKNHMAVLHAAELLWHRGEEFSLVFIGGNSWNSEPFFDRLDELRSKGRRVESLSAAPDHLVSSAYRSAACSVFVSLHEGFGLPIVESLACGTPVVTSDYGAMAHNARHGGCLLVDPRDPHQIAEAISRVINHDGLRHKLRSEAAAIAARTWDTYAQEAWDFLVHGRPPSQSMLGKRQTGSAS